MGIVHYGVPRQMSIDLRDEYDLRWFIETGTQIGGTTAWAAQNFQRVLAIESVPHYFRFTREACRSFSNVLLFLGDSQDILPIALNIINSPALVFLDAHWSPDLKAERPDVICPVIEEIKIINADNREHIILVDDARLFQEERTEGWPYFSEVKEALEEVDRRVYVIDDVIKAVPHER